MIIHTQKGFSGALVEIIEDSNWVVKKTGDIRRNVTQLELLKETGLPVPAIIYHDEDTLVMEYVDGLPIDTLIGSYGIRDLFEDLVEYITYFKLDTLDFDYKGVYQTFLAEIDFSNLPFTVDELLDRLPKILPRSRYYHGDFTLGNMIYSGRTFMIDPVSTVFDSWVFDIAKLRQDLDGLWFIRDYDNVHMAPILRELGLKLRHEFPEAYDDNLYILMLLRVYRHCKKDTLEYNLIRNEMLRLWK
jgi:hypothetical protein